MLNISIPGWDSLQLSSLLLDFNGTLAVDGILIEGVKQRLITLAKDLEIHIATGDTFGTAKKQLADIPCQIKILPSEDQALAKEEYIQQLDPLKTVAIGNGRNDKLMLERAVLGILVIGNEGSAVETLVGADLVFPNILTALDVLLNPLRLTASLRS